MSNERRVDESTVKVYDCGSDHLKDIDMTRVNDQNCDVTLRFGSQTKRAHKSVLASMFLYFERMFTHPLQENNTSVVDIFVSNKKTHPFEENISGFASISRVDEDIIESFIRLAYTGTLTVDRNNVESVFIAADYFQNDDLKRFCEEFFVEQLDGSNALNFRKFGKCFHLVNLVKAADKVITRNFLEVVNSVHLPLLEKEEFSTLISRSDLEVELEEDIFHAIKLWISHDYARRSMYIYELLQHVRLAIIQPRYLEDDVATFSPCMNSNDCQLLIENLRDYQLNYELDDFDPKKVKPRGFTEGKIYIFDRLLLQSFIKGRCEIISSLFSVKFISCGLAVWNGNIYLTGGYDRGHLKTCELFSIDDSVSEFVSLMNCNRLRHGCCVHAAELFVCGGREGVASTCCEKLTSVDEKWRFIADMKVDRVCFPVVSCGNFMYALGGWDIDLTVLNSTEYYNKITDEWTLSIPMREERVFHAAVAFRDKIFVIGGQNGNGCPLNTAEVLDTKLNQISSLRPMRVPRYSFAATISGNKLYCFGGLTNNDDNYEDPRLLSVESFNLYTKYWHDEEEMDHIGLSNAAVTLF